MIQASRSSSRKAVISSVLPKVALSEKVAYTAIGAITAIDPVTVTFADDVFTVPRSLSAFSFRDDGALINASFDGTTWSFSPEYALTLTSTGTGLGVSTLRMRSNADLVVTLGGTAKFYTDAAGTEGETDTWTVTSGAMRTIYLRCPLVGGVAQVASMTLSDPRRLVRWGESFDVQGWVSGTNAATIAGDISIFGVSLTHTDVRGLNTISGSVTLLTSLTRLVFLNNAALSGSITGLISLTVLIVESPLSGSIAALTSLIWLQTPSPLSGSIAALTNLIYLRIEDFNTITYSTHTRAAGQIYVLTVPAAGHGWPADNADGLTNSVSQAIIDSAAPTWTSSKVFSLDGEHASMADTTQGGRWGTFDGEQTPSAVATALKTLVKTRLVIVSLNGVTMPGETGDGTGFPVGFGDWWRS